MGDMLSQEELYALLAGIPDLSIIEYINKGYQLNFIKGLLTEAGVPEGNINSVTDKIILRLEEKYGKNLDDTATDAIQEEIDDSIRSTVEQIKDRLAQLQEQSGESKEEKEGDQ